MPIDLPVKSPPQLAKPQARPFEITGRMVFFMLVAFFAVVASVNFYMMSVALRTMPGIDVKSSYESSQNYNRDIQRAREQSLRGWQADVTFIEKGTRTITISMKDKNGEPVKGLDMAVRFAHPSDRKADHTTRLSELSPGQYTGDAAPRGVWDLQIEAQHGGNVMFKSQSRLHP